MARAHVPKACQGLPQSDPVSIYQIIFGSCGAVVESASCFMMARRVSQDDLNKDNATVQNFCSRTTTPNNRATPQIIPTSKSSQEVMHYLKRSKEVMEIPEYLEPEFLEHKVNCDEISALSALTLDEMARNPRSCLPRNGTKRRKVKSRMCYLPPSPARTIGSSSSEGVDKYDTFVVHDQFLLPPPKIKKITSSLTHDSLYFSSSCTVDSTNCSSDKLQLEGNQSIFRIDLRGENRR